MNLQQLRYVVEIVRQGSRLSAAANSLNTSQPGVSRQIQRLEHELGFQIFTRTRNRIIGLTEPGNIVFTVAQRVATDIDTLKRLKEDRNSGRGIFTIATTITQARYILPPICKQFLGRYPNVQLTLRQGDPEQVCEMVEAGEADLAICTETTRSFPKLIKLNCYEVKRCVVTPTGHPLLRVPELTLEEIAKYPLITYDTQYSGRWKVMKAFADAGLNPKIIMSGTEADVCKTYVAIGLGIGILGSLAYDKKRDTGIEAIDASRILPSSTVMVALRPNTYLRPFLLDFIHRVGPEWTPAAVRQAVRNYQDAGVDGASK